MNKTKIKNILSKVLKLLCFIVMAFLCVIVVFLLYYVISSQIKANDENYKPKISLYTIVSPSMTPVIKVYDVVINKRIEKPEDIQMGDIITYISEAPSSEGMTITHRVIAINTLQDGSLEFMTQGDNNSEPDSLYVKYDQIIGKEIMIVPAVGKIQFILASKKSWLILLLIPIVAYAIKEIIKLIDLFGLRKRVDKVTGISENNIIEQRKITKQEQEIKKEQIKEEIKNKEIKKDSLIKSFKEPEGFLEEYSETFVEVTENKYKKETRKKKEIISDTKDIKEQIDKIEEIKEKPTIINKTIEILDTDELTSKIKEYDSKIEKLDKIIADIESISKPKEIETEELPEMLEMDDYLLGSKIKVTKVEETKNQKRKTTPRKSQTKQPIELKTENKIDLAEPKQPTRREEKVLRPIGEDIKELRERELKKIEEKDIPKKQKLNLNPSKPKKVTRTRTRRNNNSRRNLNLNPSRTKKVSRGRRRPEPPKKQHLIEIKKVK